VVFSADPARPLAAALATLHNRYGVRTLVCEGGPTLFAALVAERLVDELCLTLAPKLVGGGGAGSIMPTEAGPYAGVELTLSSVLEYGESLLLRYKLAYT
jgi:5-amino-6-(5-phosphoribosylamino)uracil reductase